MSAAPEVPHTVNEMSVILKRDPQTVRRYARTGVVPAHKLGGEWIFYPSEVEAHIRAAPGWNQSPQSRGRKRAA